MTHGTHTTTPFGAIDHEASGGAITRRTAVAGAVALGAAGAVSSLGMAEAAAATAGLYEKINAIDASTSGGLSVAVHDRRSMRVWQYNAPFRNECASIVKVLILTTVCARAQAAGRGLSAWEKSQASPMIRSSSNDAATNLWRSVGGAPGVQAVATSLGMTATRATTAWGLTTTSAYDQLLLLNEIAWRGRVLNATHRSYMLGLMGQVDAGQRWGVGSVGVSQVKNGWLPYGGAWRINSIGHVGGSGRDHTLAILQRTPTMAVGTSVANRVAATIHAHLATAL